MEVRDIEVKNRSKEFKDYDDDDDLCNYTDSITDWSKLITEKTKTFQCEICSTKFNKDSLLRQHKLTHTNKKSFQCDMCNRVFTNKHSLKGHTRVIFVIHHTYTKEI